MRHGPRGTACCAGLLAIGLVPCRVKALVWFWLIDEILSANLVYQSDYEIGSTTLSGEANDDGDAMVMIKCLDLEKKNEKSKSSRQR